ncbi:hypothetical protein LNP00_00440 [Fructobacillus sp. M158]|uniref:hypothetical protein n=1 Tax=Fructobacillus parabroussonetiae TaxID=2713174 RepID=UPI002009F726|nr:hypothetical protein [Fructobacillus parabroussonetiae]MCK8616839.1 hypothetical protein [Fructobacillus parabroussonetiae]
MKLAKFIHSITNVILFVLIFTTLIGSISLLKGTVDSMDNSVIVILNIIAVMVFAGYMVKRFMPKNKLNNLWNLTKKIVSNKFFLFAILAFAFVWQLMCFYTLTGYGQWDYMIIAKQVIADHVPGHAGFAEYFSYYPNNLLLLRLEDIFWQLIGQPKLQMFIAALNLANLIVVDVATLLLLNVFRKEFSKKISTVSFIFVLFSFTLVPFFVIPYSDTIAFFITSVFLNLLFLKKNLKKTSHFVAWGIAIGILLVIAYFLKPSLVILFIAAVITAVLILWKRRPSFTEWKINGVLSAIIILTALLFGMFMKHDLEHHDYSFKIDPSRAFPLSTFAAMGSVNGGGYNFDYSITSTEIKDSRERNDYAIELVKHNIGSKGFFGYQKFLFQKQVNNASDGTFGWGQEGNFLTVYEKNNGTKNRLLPRKIFVQKDGQAKGMEYSFRFFEQIIWITLLFFMLFSVWSNGNFAIYLKITTVGFFLFLLIFEGGRSRYLIQFLPILFLLAAEGMTVFKNFIKKG